MSVYKYRRIKRRNILADARTLSHLGFSPGFDNNYDTVGLGPGDVNFLFQYVKKKRPRRIIEFGTGTSTWVIAKAMEMYCWEHYDGDISLVSLEDKKEWFDKQIKHFPKEKIENYQEFVTILLSPLEEFRYNFVFGTSYKHTPLEDFDLCFIDGPNGSPMCNMEFIKLLECSSTRMSCLIDGRKSTQIAYAALLGKEKMTRFHTGLCLFERVTKDDLKTRDYNSNYKKVFPENETILRA